MLSQTFERPPTALGVLPKGEIPFGLPNLQLWTQRAEPSWPSIRAWGRQVLHRAQEGQTKVQQQKILTQEQDQGVTCAAAQNTGHREVQATALLVTHIQVK